MNNEISKILKCMGFSAAHIGYGYCRMAIFLAVKNPWMIRHLNTALYPAVAKYFHVSTGTVEKGIRSAVEAAWLRGNSRIHNQLFQYSVDSSRGKPTNQEFLSVITEYLLLQKENDGILEEIWIFS